MDVNNIKIDNLSNFFFSNIKKNKMMRIIIKTPVAIEKLFAYFEKRIN